MNNELTREALQKIIEELEKTKESLKILSRANKERVKELNFSDKIPFGIL